MYAPLNMLSLQNRVSNVTQCLQDNGLTISSYIHHLSRSLEPTPAFQEAQKMLVAHAVNICQELYNFLPTRSAVVGWVLDMAVDIFNCEVRELAQDQHG